MITIEKINAFTEEGSVIGDVCEKCETEAKPIYHLHAMQFGLDIILCPACIKNFQQHVREISLVSET